MSDIIKIRKGLDIPVRGEAQCITSDVRSIGECAVKPTDFVGVTPKLLVAEGDMVKAGTPLFHDKNNASARFVSPVSGTVKAIVRGEKRKVLAVVVSADGKHESEPYRSYGFEQALPREEVMQQMVEGGLMPLIKRRPFGTAPMEGDQPRDIFVSLFDTAPLAPNMDYVLQGRADDLRMGLRVLLAITDCNIHLGLREGQELEQVCRRLAEGKEMQGRVKVHLFKGGHPAGNVGTQIAAVRPINKGEVVWTLDAQNLAILGNTFLTGAYRPERMVAVAGPCVSSPRYYKMHCGANLSQLFAEQCKHYTESDVRLICGNVLSGTQVAHDDYLCTATNLISAIPEGDYYDFMGWLMPGFKKFSANRTFFSGWLNGCPAGEKMKKRIAFDINTNLHGEWRPMVVTGSYERVFPFKIYPMQLIKAAIIGDIDLMESLGIYEVEPEDFALCEFVDTSKTEIQLIIREALEKLRKEAM